MGMDTGHINFYGIYIDDQWSDVLANLVYGEDSPYGEDGSSPVTLVPAGAECHAAVFRRYSYSGGSGGYKLRGTQPYGTPTQEEREEFERICISLGMTDFTYLGRHENDWIFS